MIEKVKKNTPILSTSFAAIRFIRGKPCKSNKLYYCKDGLQWMSFFFHLVWTLIKIHIKTMCSVFQVSKDLDFAISEPRHNWRTNKKKASDLSSQNLAYRCRHIAKSNFQPQRPNLSVTVTLWRLVWGGINASNILNVQMCMHVFLW